MIAPRTAFAALALWLVALAAEAQEQEPPSGPEKVAKALAQETSVDFKETPLLEVAEWLSSRFGIAVRLDARALSDAGLGDREPISLTLNNVRLRTVLDQMLEPLDLAWRIEGEVLRITTIEEAEARLEVRAYPVRDIVQSIDPQTGEKIDEPDFESLGNLITTIIEPESWSEGTGPSSDFTELEKEGLILLNQTAAVHEKIAWLLDALHRLRQMQQAGLRPPTSLTFLPAEDGFARSQKRLDQQVQVDFNATPLNQALKLLAEKTGGPLLLDRRSLDDHGIDVDVPVTLTAKDVTLRSALRLLLKPLGLDMIADGEVILVTSVEEARTRMGARVYPVSDLVRTYDHLGRPAQLEFEPLITLITELISPDSWEHVGGPGSIAEYEPCGALVVSAYDDMHRRIEQLLRALRKARSLQSTPVEKPSLEVISTLSESDMAAEQRIEKLLDRRVSVDFNRIPLDDMARQFRQQHGLPLHIDQQALQDVGAWPLNITRKWSDARLRDLLHEITGEADLAMLVQNESLVITSIEEAEFHSQIKVYPVADLIDYNNYPSGLGDNYDSLLYAVRLMGGVEDWGEWKDGSPHRAMECPLAAALVIAHTQKSHVRIERGLKEIRAKRQPVPAGAEADKPRLRSYRLREFDPHVRRPSEEQLVALVQELIAPESWQADGGAKIRAIPGRLSVRQPLAVQRQVQALLRELDLVDSRAAWLRWQLPFEHGLPRWRPPEAPLGEPEQQPDEPTGKQSSQWRIPRQVLAQGFGGAQRFIGAWWTPYEQDHRERHPVYWTLPRGFADQVTVRAYHVNQPPESDQPTPPTSQEIAAQLVEFVAPDSWNEGQALIRPLPGVLVIRQPNRIHQQVADFLDELEVMPAVPWKNRAELESELQWRMQMNRGGMFDGGNFF